MPESRCTPGQTVGPFFSIGLPFPGDNQLVKAAHPGAVRLHGTVYDGANEPIPDALVELWQADADGRAPRAPGSLLRADRDTRDDLAFTGFGRCATDVDGHYHFTTVAPGAPRFFALTVFARGLLHRLFTRAYLPDGDLTVDPALSSLDAERRATLLCIAENTSGRTSYRFDIHLQGPRETVFLVYPGELG
ncbi:protocatechuate 3,4-dioxygenase subunit alpha [Mycobacterium intermedium]|uniref:Protocatechuate 3,4-dioxygenase subunit alpha n=1 Tax=Mycobacterium intermedium TaxID=28445 RepID=A0A1E3SF81_MYCIE|nr:protocatechuate 3,4-dioxygenase subunit alpha [Mycobacterium intermedium]MCV6966014.1 protocatechuate 3,4-dioxygenase subunit alpha [Mycobacterium intermedium]ODR00313.1 protocatechuate 3,4-dioxygenase subunit alpha [Mycobacterium intermedium]OPE48992.1 protocatechuate 3,4-dioxygenase subunit alpha [Mycobacterium intermedium]ORB01879.1 protocatechuate 3,4-dioxygenase subunit alpha [Mycobacterium intermedium]